MKKDLADILLRPRITEKATLSSEQSVYVFDIPKTATKEVVAKAFVKKYAVTPRKIATVHTAGKRVFVRGKRGSQADTHKAYVYLKKGTKIEII